MRIGILAGEASGDVLGAKLINAVHQQCPNIQFEGIGGPAMISAGCRSLFNIERLAVMGFVEPFLRLPELIRLRSLLYRHFIKYPPDVFIGIDAPDFNLGLEYKLKQAGIPIIHYVSPSVWAWRQHRVHKIAKTVDLMLTLLPFETKFYEQYNVPVQYVGHPLAEQIPLQPDSDLAKRALCIDENADYIALLPGSRRQEIRYMAEPILKAAKMVWQQKPHLRFLTTQVNEQRYQEFHEAYKQFAPELPLTFFSRRSQDVIAAANMVVVTSGTATLETMLYKKPMIIAYRMSSLTYQIAKWLVKTPYIGLPNLLANELLVPELIQKEANAKRIAQFLLEYLDNPNKTRELQLRFTDIHQAMRTDSVRSIADAVLNVVKEKRSSM